MNRGRRRNFLWDGLLDDFVTCDTTALSTKTIQCFQKTRTSTSTCWSFPTLDFLHIYCVYWAQLEGWPQYSFSWLLRFCVKFSVLMRCSHTYSTAVPKSRLYYLLSLLVISSTYVSHLLCSQPSAEWSFSFLGFAGWHAMSTDYQLRK